MDVFNRPVLKPLVRQLARIFFARQGGGRRRADARRGRQRGIAENIPQDVVQGVSGQV